MSRSMASSCCSMIFTTAWMLFWTGFDWACVDLEHGAIDLATTADNFRGLAGFDCVPVARLPLNDPIWIHRTLDAGARGLIIPMVKSAAEAEAAVREAKYPPCGVRGYGYSRANLYGADWGRIRKVCARNLISGARVGALFASGVVLEPITLLLGRVFGTRLGQI